MTTQTVDAAEIAALADRCEAASGPDRNIDAMIHHTLNNGVGVGYAADAPQFTASLDAAMTLVPEGSLFTARTVWDKMKPAGLGVVSRYEKGEFGGHERLYWMDEHQAVAATPALALTAAALRARAHLLQQERSA